VSALPRLAGYGGAVAAVCGAAAVAGALIEPTPPGGSARAATAPAMAMAAEHGGAGGPMPVRGLAVAENGLRLVVEDPAFRRGVARAVRFRIVDRSGGAVRDFDVEHTRRMHLIVARRDLTGFQHLHPVMAADGTWSAPLRLRAAGSYRLFADFAVRGRPTTLASDLRVSGRARLRALPVPAERAVSDGGYDVRLTGAAPRAGREAELRFAVTRGGRDVRTGRYLGAGGHLVALRGGDLAFLHVHPEEHGGPAARGIGFRATFPTPGPYRLFLQFLAGGRVQTVAFTVEVTR
jgi:hypothetical protein